jgi:hypothetical protein
VTRKPQPWYAQYNQPPRSPADGRNRKPSPQTHRSTPNRADPPDYGTGPADDALDAFALAITSFRTFYPTFEPIKPPAIPYAGVRAGEIIGHRMWMVLGNLELCSLAHHFIWEPGATIEGDVDKVVSDNFPYFIRRPIYGGTYSYNSIDHILQSGDLNGVDPTKFPISISFDAFFAPYKFFQLHAIAIGTIKMWGEVVEHDKGYRAQYAKLRSIDQVLGPVDILELRRKYNV